MTEVAEDMDMPFCGGCERHIDPDCCWCGDWLQNHKAYNQNHGFVPMGCVCYRNDNDR